MHQNMVKIIEAHAATMDEELLALIISTNDSTSEVLDIYEQAKTGQPGAQRPKSTHIDISTLPPPSVTLEDEQPLKRRMKRGWAELPPSGKAPAPPAPSKHDPVPRVDDLVLNFNEVSLESGPSNTKQKPAPSNNKAGRIHIPFFSSL